MNKCRICNGKLELVIDLGKQPSANDLCTEEELARVKSYPLRYFICENCTLVQQIPKDFVPDKKLWSNYLYMTSANKALIPQYKEMASELFKMAKNKDLAYVIASNDGTELQLLKEAGFKNTIGVEPSNLAKVANDKGLRTVPEFFTYKLSKRLASSGKADLIVANNVAAHIPDPLDFFEGIANLIADDGIISIQVNWVKPIVDSLALEVFYAEHHYLWSITALEITANKVGLNIIDIVDLPEQQGGSLRYILSKKHKPSSQSTINRFKKEETPTIKSINTLQARADERKDKFIKLVKDIKAKGKSISIYSVPAKIATILNFCNLTNKEIDFAYDVSTTKIGRFIPKANILIKDEKLVIKDNPDYLIIGAFNYFDFLKGKLKWYIDNGGHIINPLTCEVI